jgi:hypothetical protein
MTNHSAILSASQVLGPEAIAKLTYHGQWSEGFHSSVYRYASVYAGERLAYQTPERLPDERARHAVVAAMNARLVGPLYGQADYRFYGDSWGLYGHTAGLRLVYEWSPDLSLRVRERLATQGSVSFYEPRYQVARTHMTTDKELTALWSSTSGLKVEYGLRAAAAALGLSTLSLNLKVDFMHISYSEFERIEFINAQVGEAGVAATF